MLTPPFRLMAAAAVTVIGTIVDAMALGDIAGPSIAIGVSREPPLAHTIKTDAECPIEFNPHQPTRQCSAAIRAVCRDTPLAHMTALWGGCARTPPIAHPPTHTRAHIHSQTHDMHTCILTRCFHDQRTDKARYLSNICLHFDVGLHAPPRLSLNSATNPTKLSSRYAQNSSGEQPRSPT